MNVIHYSFSFRFLFLNYVECFFPNCELFEWENQWEENLFLFTEFCLIHFLSNHLQTHKTSLRAIEKHFLNIKNWENFQMKYKFWFRFRDRVLSFWIKKHCLVDNRVQSINDAFHIVVKVESVCVNNYIFDLNDNVECVVYALYSSITMIYLDQPRPPKITWYR
jgi:hypothetical protein